MPDCSLLLRVIPCYSLLCLTIPHYYLLFLTKILTKKMPLVDLSKKKGSSLGDFDRFRPQRRLPVPAQPVPDVLHAEAPCGLLLQPIRLKPGCQAQLDMERLQPAARSRGCEESMMLGRW